MALEDIVPTRQEVAAAIRAARPHDAQGRTRPLPEKASERAAIRRKAVHDMLLTRNIPQAAIDKVLSDLHSYPEFEAPQPTGPREV